MDASRDMAAAELVIAANGPAILIPEGADVPSAWRLVDGRLEVLSEDAVIAAVDLTSAGVALAVIDRHTDVACVRVDDDGPAGDWTLARQA